MSWLREHYDHLIAAYERADEFLHSELTDARATRYALQLAVDEDFNAARHALTKALENNERPPGKPVTLDELKELPRLTSRSTESPGS